MYKMFVALLIVIVVAGSAAITTLPDVMYCLNYDASQPRDFPTPRYDNALEMRRKWLAQEDAAEHWKRLTEGNVDD